MRPNINTTAIKSITLFLLFLSFCFNNALESAAESESAGETGNELVAEVMKDMEDVMAENEKRKKALEELVRTPLTEAQQKLLRQLSEQNGRLDEVLSSKPYLDYLKSEIGEEYKDFTAYVAAMPTSKQKTGILFSFKEVFPSNTKAEALSICTNYYFKLRSLLVKEPNILDDLNAAVSFQTKHLMEPLMATYPAAEKFSHMSELMQMSMVATLIAQMNTEVYREAWHERLEKYGSLEGLLRCAIATPAEFALIHSFCEDTAALEKWIRMPLKTENKSKEKQKK